MRIPGYIIIRVVAVSRDGAVCLLTAGSGGHYVENSDGAAAAAYHETGVAVPVAGEDACKQCWVKYNRSVSPCVPRAPQRVVTLAISGSVELLTPLKAYSSRNQNWLRAGL